MPPRGKSWSARFLAGQLEAVASPVQLHNAVVSDWPANSGGEPRADRPALAALKGSGGRACVGGWSFVRRGVQVDLMPESSSFMKPLVRELAVARRARR